MGRSGETLNDLNVWIVRFVDHYVLWFCVYSECRGMGEKVPARYTRPHHGRSSRKQFSAAGGR